MREQWSDLSHGKFSSALCHYVAEAHDGSIIGDAQNYVSSEHDVDYWAKLGKRRIYHVDSQGFHYLWRYESDVVRDYEFAVATLHLVPVSSWAASQLREDGDTVDLPDGRKLRLRLKPDDTNPFEEYDCYGRIAPVGPVWDRHGERTRRPDGFDGKAEKLWPPQNCDQVWWQPPADVKRSDPHFAELRDQVRDLVAFGMQGAVVELLDTEPDAYHQPAVRETASLWGLEPFIDKDYLATVVGELIDEIMEDET